MQSLSKLFLLTFMCLVVQIVTAQKKEIPVTLYETGEHMLQKNAMDVQAIAVVKKQGTKHIFIQKIVDAATGKKIKGVNPWALEYNGENYFHLAFSHDLNKPNLYVKLDIEGKYCATFIDDGTADIVLNADTQYEYGLLGFGVSKAISGNKNWKTRYGYKRKILFMDTTQRRSDGKLVPVQGNYLSRRQVKEMLKEHYPGREDEELDFESVAALIRTINAK